MVIRMIRIVLCVISIYLFICQGVEAQENVSIKLVGVPDRLILPLPKGTNQIITAKINGGVVQSAWLAPGRESTGRMMLTKVDATEYQINLADPLVSAMLIASDLKQFYVFVETTDKQVIASIPIQYSTVRSLASYPTTVTVYIRKGENREKLESWYSRTWQNPDRVDAFEIAFSPIEAECSVKADVNRHSWTFLKDEEHPGLLNLKMTDEIRKAWQNFGSLSISFDFQKDPVFMYAIPKILACDKIPAAMTIMQYRSESLPCSNEYLHVCLGDITAGQVLLSIHTQDGKQLLKNRSIKQGDCVEFEYGVKKYRLVLLSLFNVLFGDDYAVFLFFPKTLTEQQKIIFLLQALSNSKVSLIWNEKEYSGSAAESHIRKELHMAENSYETMEGFLSGIASHSWASGQKYLVKQLDGSTCELILWFREIASQFIVE